jgi:hypothetical protein
VSVLGVLQSLPRMLAAGQMIRLSALLFSTAMAVRGDVVEFRRSLVIFVMRSVVIACGPKLETHDRPDVVWASLASS